jgi:hypothetical protein
LLTLDRVRAPPRTPRVRPLYGSIALAVTAAAPSKNETATVAATAGHKRAEGP